MKFRELRELSEFGELRCFDRQLFTVPGTQTPAFHESSISSLGF